MSITLVIVFFAMQLNAQQTVIIGDGVQSGTASNGPAGDSGPMYKSTGGSAFNHSRYHYLYTEAELLAAGITPGMIIQKIAWNKDNAAASNYDFTFEIWLQNSNLTTVQTPPQDWADLTLNSTQVYNSATTSLSSAIGWVEFEVANFAYTGGALEISTNFDLQGSNPYTTDGISWKRDPITNRTLSYTNSTPGTTLNNLRTVRPQIRFTLGSNTPDDAGVSSLSSPLNFCAGTEDIKVMIRNYGNNVLDSVKVAWELNGLVQTPISITTPLDTAGGLGINEIEVTLGSHTFANASVDIKAWTYEPNGIADTSNQNDTITKTLQASLSGNYTINSASPTGGTNYNSFEDFTDALNTYGVCGPVIADVVAGSGPYNELVAFGNITGASAINHIRINGNGNTVEYLNTTTSGERHLLLLDGTKHLRIDSLTFKALEPTTAWGALITGGAAYDSLTNCVFDHSLVTATASASNSGILFSGSNSSAATTGNNGSHCYIAGNHLLSANGTGGMYYGIIINGGGNDSNIVENNIVENAFFTGIRALGKGTIIRNNVVHRSNKTASHTGTFYGIHTPTGDMSNSQIMGNRIYRPGGSGSTSPTGSFYGIYALGDGTTTDPVLIANNAIYNTNKGGNLYAIYLNAAQHTLVYHNTVSIDQVNTGTSGNRGIFATGANPGLEIKNNNVSITAGSGGVKHGFYYTSANSVEDAQMNNFYVNSSQSGTQNYGYYTSVYASQAAFQTAYPTMEIGSPEVDPQFVDLTVGDLTVQNTSLHGVGEDLTNYVPVDINGIPRSVTPTIGAFEQPPAGHNNAGVLGFTSPIGSYCEGVQQAAIIINNAGQNDITGVEVHWEVDGVAQTTVNYSGTLNPTTNPTGKSFDTVILGNVNIPNSSDIEIKAWTSLPNSVADTVNADDTLSMNFQASTFEIIVVADTICSGADVALSLMPNTDIRGNILWQSSTDGTTWNNIINSDSIDLIEVGLTQNTWYRVQIGDSSNYCFTDSIKIEVLDVVLTGANSGERCGPGSVELSASTNPGLDIKWYEDQTGGAAIATGATFNTPNLTTTTEFWVSASSGGGMDNVGPIDPSIGNGGYTASTTYVTYFTVNAPVTLMSVDIFANNVGGSSALEIVDLSTNTVVGTYPYTVTIAGSLTNGQTIPINETLPPGDYSIGMANTSVSLYRNTTGAVFPYSIPELSITGQSFSNQNYNYYFYNWTISSGCESPRQLVTATIKPVPTVALGNDTTICQGSSLTLDAGNPGLDFEWNDNSTNQTLTVNSSGLYSVTVTDTANCSASDTIDVEVTNPMVNLGNDTIICEGVILTLDAGNPGMTYEWNDNSSGQTLDVTSTGTYYVTVSNGGCQDIDTIQVEVVPLPLVNLGEDTIVCNAPSLTLDAGNSGMDYIWNDNSINQTLTVTANGTYSVTVTNSADCAVSDTIQVQFATMPTRNFDPSINLCIGDTLNLNAGNAGSSFEWSTSAVTQSIRLHQAGTYTVKVTNSSGCSDTFSTLIIHRNLPVINLGNDTIICRGDSINLDAENSPGSIYTWSTGENDRIITVGDEETYTVTVTNQYGCVSSELRRVFHFEDPFVEGFNFVPVGQQGSGQRVNFFPIEEENVFAYEWDFGDGSPISTDRFPSHVYNTSGVFTVKLRVFNECEYYEVFLPVNVDLTTGIIIIDGEVIDINLYPNPSNNQIVIEHQLDNVIMENVTIYNAIGSEVYKASVNGSKEIISVSHLVSGVYLARIMTNKGVVVKRFEVVK